MKAFHRKEPESKKEPVVAPKITAPVIPTPEGEYVLKRDVNLSLKKGMKVSAEKYGEMVQKGMKEWF